MAWWTAEYDMTWWIARSTSQEVPILVVNGRVATPVPGFIFLDAVGKLWSEVRATLEAAGFKCTMETP